MKPMSLLVYNFVVHNDSHLCSGTSDFRLFLHIMSSICGGFLVHDWPIIDQKQSIYLLVILQCLNTFLSQSLVWCGLFAWSRNLSEANKTHFLTLRRPSCTGVVGRFCQMFWWNWKQTQFTFLSWKRSSPWVLWSVQRQTSSDPVNGNNNAT